MLNIGKSSTMIDENSISIVLCRSRIALLQGQHDELRSRSLLGFPLLRSRLSQKKNNHAFNNLNPTCGCRKNDWYLPVATSVPSWQSRETRRRVLGRHLPHAQGCQSLQVVLVRSDVSKYQTNRLVAWLFPTFIWTSSIATLDEGNHLDTTVKEGQPRVPG